MAIKKLCGGWHHVGICGGFLLGADLADQRIEGESGDSRDWGMLIGCNYGAQVASASNF